MWKKNNQQIDISNDHNFIFVLYFPASFLEQVIAKQWILKNRLFHFQQYAAKIYDILWNIIIIKFSHVVIFVFKLNCITGFLYWAFLISRDSWSLGVWKLDCDFLRLREDEDFFLAQKWWKWVKTCIDRNDSLM